MLKFLSIKGGDLLKLKELVTPRLEFIDAKVNEFILSNHIQYWPIDCIQVILKIQEENRLKLHLNSTLQLPHRVDARTICIGSSYYTFVNKNKIHYPYRKSSDRRLNFTLAHELGHIYLNHFDLPNEIKSEGLVLFEHLEAHEFAGRLLMPKTLIKNRASKSTHFLAKNFNVSEKALRTRLQKLKIET